MNLYALQQDDVRDVLALIASPTLSITANGAQRVAQLQQLFATLEPNTAYDASVAREQELAAELARVREELELVTAHRESAYAMLKEERDRYQVLEVAQWRASSSEHESTSNLCDAERMHADEELTNERVCHSTHHAVKG